MRTPRASGLPMLRMQCRGATWLIRPYTDLPGALCPTGWCWHAHTSWRRHTDRAAASATQAATPAAIQQQITDASAALQSSTPRSRARPEAIDFSVLAACCSELRDRWVPSRVDKAVMTDEHTLALFLRTPDAKGWLHLCWHPRAARVCIGPEPTRGQAAEAYPLADFAHQTCAAALPPRMPACMGPDSWHSGLHVVCGMSLALRRDDQFPFSR